MLQFNTFKDFIKDVHAKGGCTLRLHGTEWTTWESLTSDSISQRYVIATSDHVKIYIGNDVDDVNDILIHDIIQSLKTRHGHVGLWINNLYLYIEVVFFEASLIRAMYHKDMQGQESIYDLQLGVTIEDKDVTFMIDAIYHSGKTDNGHKEKSAIEAYQHYALNDKGQYRMPRIIALHEDKASGQVTCDAIDYRRLNKGNDNL